MLIRSSQKTDAPEDLELTLFENEKEMFVHAVHLLEKSKMPTVSPFKISAFITQIVRGVEILPEKDRSVSKF